ncbi:hypothetical protein APHAL10511_006733 [Amanita phalloides]|nr:hypothetical protein APHAL10511_006733 [Amanita phalloides]
MFSGAVQSPVLSLFSSTSSEPLRLFSLHKDNSLPADSFIHLLHDETSFPPPTPPANLISSPAIVGETETESPAYSLNQTVLHIQSPTLPTTYIHSPPIQQPLLEAHRRSSDELWVKHPWLHIQVRNMGREWSLEVGLVDQTGRSGILRLSTFQKQAKLVLRNRFPLLHLPLTFPHASSRPLTAWATLSLHLPSYLQQFNSIQHHSEEGDVTSIATCVPGGSYSHLSYVRVYATCRLRRIWFTESGSIQQLPQEFQLFGSS